MEAELRLGYKKQNRSGEERGDAEKDHEMEEEDFFEGKFFLEWRQKK